MIAIGVQPRRYGSKSLAKSRSLVMLMRGPTVNDPRPNRWHIACFGNAGHYESASGICVHVDGVGWQ